MPRPLLQVVLLAHSPVKSVLTVKTTDKVNIVVKALLCKWSQWSVAQFWYRTAYTATCRFYECLDQVLKYFFPLCFVSQNLNLKTLLWLLSIFQGVFKAPIGFPGLRTVRTPVAAGSALPDKSVPEEETLQPLIGCRAALQSLSCSDSSHTDRSGRLVKLRLS